MDASNTNDLHSRNLCIGYDQQIVVDDLCMRIPDGNITAIVGANGCGKSTILKAVSRILAPMTGGVYLDGREIRSTPTRELARRMSILPQASHAPESLTVGDLVSYGRFPHRRWLHASTRQDSEMIRWALRVVGLDALRERAVNSLSGGQQQCAWIAMTLAQGSAYILLDEPTSHLDMSHQLEIMELLKRLNRDEGKTIVMVLHDLNLAARYAQHIIAVKDGRIVIADAPDRVMTSEVIARVFGIRARIISDPHYGVPVCLAYPAIGGDEQELPPLSSRSPCAPFSTASPLESGHRG